MRGKRMNLLPWRIRRLLAWAYANRHALVALKRKVSGQFKRRILVSTAFFGGVGGTEKHLKSLIESMPDCFFHVRARDLRLAGFTPDSSNYVVNMAFGDGRAYDLYLYFAGGGKPPLEFGNHTFSASLLDTNGANVQDIEDRFDQIAIQTGHYDKYCSQHHKCVLAFPDVPATFPRRRVPVNLPSRYFLTVFNPFSDALKGHEALYRAADAAAWPIVWCYSDKSGFDFAHLPEHPNIIKRKNLTQEALYYVYEHASAYVSFSHMESFGWSLAEAFYLGLPILARDVGFLSLVDEQSGVCLYAAEAELHALLQRTDYTQHTYNDTLFKDNAFPIVIDRILARSKGGAQKT